MKKKPQLHSFWGGVEDKLVAVAHRGGDAAGISKENSLAAFKAAYKMGYRWFETDVVATSDDKLLAIHGRGYQRRPNKELPSRLRLQRWSYEDVKKRIRVGDEPPLLLTELLDTFPNTKVFIDPKTYQTAPVLANLLIDKPEYIDRVMVGSFLPFNTSKVRRTVSRATGKEVEASILGPARSSLIRLASWLSWLTPLARYHVRLTRASSVHVPYKWITGGGGDRLINTASRLGLKVGVYTPNEADSIRACREKNVDIIITDSIGLLKEMVLEMDSANPTIISKV